MPTAQAATLDSPASKPKYKRLTAADHSYILKLAEQKLTQAEIAQRIGCSQQAISQTLDQFTDKTSEAKLYLRGSALAMAQNVVRKGRAADHVAALKGLSVLQDEQRSAVTVLVGGNGQVNIGLALSPTPVQVQSEGVQIHSVKQLESDN